jgi:tetratricopeptide (TPR) repeat protein
MGTDMTSLQKTIGALLLGLSVLLGGCAIGAGEGRPILGLDGQHLDASDPVERGRALILTRQYGLAIDGLTEVVTTDPGNARALSLLAVAYGQLKRFDLADRYHARALEIDPDSSVVLNNWGYSYLVRGDDRQATDLLERAMATGDGRTIVAANLALARGSDIAATPARDEAATGDVPTRSIRISSHVTLVRPAARVRRVAPGVQMLLTIGSGETDERLLLAQAPAAPSLPMRPEDSAVSAGMDDPRFRLFRALFALMEDEPRADAPVATQLAEASFGIVSEVDDFTRP